MEVFSKEPNRTQLHQSQCVLLKLFCRQKKEGLLGVCNEYKTCVANFDDPREIEVNVTNEISFAAKRLVKGFRANGVA